MTMRRIATLVSEYFPMGPLRARQIVFALNCRRAHRTAKFFEPCIALDWIDSWFEWVMSTASPHATSQNIAASSSIKDAAPDRACAINAALSGYSLAK